MFTGIILTLVVGVLWSLVGVYYKAMAKYKLSVYNISIVTGTFSMLIFLGLFQIHLSKAGVSVSAETGAAGIRYMLFIVMSGFLNMSGSLFLQRSMVYGNSSVTWAIGQSALIIPFIGITLVFHEPWDMTKIIGTLAMLAGMFLLSMKPGNRNREAPRPRYGIVLALIAFAVLGIAQFSTGASSYLTYKDPYGMRPILMQLGSFLAIIGGKVAMKDRGFHINKKALLIILGQALQGVICMVLQFIALDKLAEHQINGIFFPVAIGTCIAGYTICSIFIYKEKTSPIVIAGTAVILAGIAGYCVAGIL